jgi:glycosyltransferase involved in cell wall biosynthesis
LKVLWFSLSPGLGDVHLNDTYKGIGWIKSLQRYMENKVELSLVFYRDNAVNPFTLGTTKYYPVTRYKAGQASKIKQRIFNTLVDIETFIKIIEEVKPDVIHVHGTEGLFGLIQKHTNIPTVVSIQGVITVYRYKYFSKISFFDTLIHSRLKNLLFFRSVINIYHQFAKMAIREQEVFKLTKHFIGRTAWDRRITSVLAPNATYYHNDEILRPLFYKNEWSNTLAPKLILFTTNGQDIYKGIETVIYCAGLLDKHHINYEWQIAGFSDNDEILNIAAASVNRSISKNIKFLGGLDEGDLVQSLLQAHIYVASSHIENSPNSLCEAQILGLPCIATHAGGTNTLLQDDVDGILIQDGDPYSLAGAIIELKNNYDKAIAYGKNSRSKALARHNPEKIASDLVRIYQTSILANQP